MRGSDELRLQLDSSYLLTQKILFCINADDVDSRITASIKKKTKPHPLDKLNGYAYPSAPVENTQHSSISSPQSEHTTRRLQFSHSSLASNSHFSVEYLIQSCGFSSDEALTASHRFPGLIKSSNKPDAVLCFLREIGISELDIRTAVLQDVRILHSHVEKNWKPNIAKLQELGFSIEDISGIMTRNPFIFRGNFVSKINFWMGVIGSVENLSVVLKMWRGALIASSLENVIMPNISFLREHCGLSTRQIVRLIKSGPKLLSSKPEFLKRVAERAEELGIDRSSASFVGALIAINCLSQRTIDARLNNLRSLGFSPEEVAVLISKYPLLLKKKEKLLGRKLEFLMKEAGCDKFYVIQYPFLLTLSLENRLIPRNTVRKLLMSKGLSVANLSFATFANLTDKKFVEKFVLPYEPAIPGLHRAFADAGTIEGIDQL